MADKMEPQFDLDVMLAPGGTITIADTRDSDLILFLLQEIKGLRKRVAAWKRCEDCDDGRHHPGDWNHWVEFPCECEVCRA
jgi:hypothetical protein